VPRRTTDEPLKRALPRLLTERGWSLRALATKADVSPSHLSRVIRGADDKAPSIALLERLARALELPHDYFVEYREAMAVEELRSDPKIREEVYRRSAAKRRRRGRPGVA
jgi:transcriptional regulator with XRE-family HTH domain